MKKLLILLFTPLICLSQGDFRKMNWGDSKEDLKRTYPKAIFEKDNEGELNILFQEGNLIGFDVLISYMFSENELVAGSYSIDPYGYKSSKSRLRDFNEISSILNERYNMERDDDWIDDHYKNNPNNLDTAIAIGDVKLVESGYFGDTKIVHTLEDGNHFLGYGSAKWVEIKRQEQQDDF